MAVAVCWIRRLEIQCQEAVAVAVRGVPVVVPVVVPFMVVVRVTAN